MFLTAEWRKLAIANYSIDPDILKPYLPAFTELDLWKGKCYVSLVGFMFLNTRVKGYAIPYHKNFEEVNLRFYVKYDDGSQLKRGVVFIKEIVPRIAISLVANTLYNEHYQTLDMKHTWEESKDNLHVQYQWKNKKWNSFQVNADPISSAIPAGSEEEFITEHYWGYTKINNKTTSEYAVEHPRWEVYPVKDYSIQVDFENVYGKVFGFFNDAKPESVMLAEGSTVGVKNNQVIRKSLTDFENNLINTN